MGIGAKIIAEARKDIGKHETGGNNGGTYVTDLLKRVHCPPHNPWCAAFACCKVKDATGQWPLGGGSAGCGTLRARAIAHGTWIPVGSKEPILRGYIGIFHGDEHAVIVVKKRRLRPVVETIAGNTSRTDGTNVNGGNVAAHTISLSKFSGFIKTH